MSTPKDEPYKKRQQEFRALAKRSQAARLVNDGKPALRDDRQWAEFRSEKITHKDKYTGVKERDLG